tara:strand:- start:580 stop:1005 length:426 start_codon:yes stop_codon:yes gene_type:complete
MAVFEGPKMDLGISPEGLKSEITNLDNLGALLPKGSVKDYSADGDKCSFKVNGGVAVSLVKDSSAQTGDVLLKLNSVAPTPLKFSLEIKAVATDAGCNCYVRSDANVNPFTRIMVEPALDSLFREISKGMQAKYPLNLCGM